MPQHPKEPHLIGIYHKDEDGNEHVDRIVRAASIPEARDYYVSNVLRAQRLTPSQAYRAGIEGAPIENAKPEYAVFDDDRPDADDEPDRDAQQGDLGLPGGIPMPVDPASTSAAPDVETTTTPTD